MSAPVCYLAYPIDLAPDRTSLTALARRLGRYFTVYEPGIAWNVTGEPDPRVQQVNMAALEASDCLVAWYPESANSVGVPIEINHAAKVLGIPCLVITDRKSWALPMDGHVRTVFGAEVEEGVAWLRAGTEATLFDIRPGVPYCKPEPQPMFFDGPGRLPTRAHDGDAGYDLYVCGDHMLRPGTFTNVAAGVSVQLPEGVWAMIVGRSSTFYKQGLVVNTAVIDQGYRGDLFACIYNPGVHSVAVKDGDRLAQMIPMPLTAAEVRPVRAEYPLEASSRGTDGFGSTGR